MNIDLVLAIVGPVMLIGGIYSLLRNIRHRKTWFKTTGKVIELTRQTDDDGNTLWAPVIKYNDQDNVSNVVHSTEFVSPFPFNVGDDIKLYFNPTDPSKFLIDNFMFEYFGPVLAIIVGLVFSIIGLVPMIRP